MVGVGIKGGASAYEAAAVVAVLTQLQAEEENRLAHPPGRPVPAAWVRVGFQPPFGRFVPPVVPE